MVSDGQLEGPRWLRQALEALARSNERADQRFAELAAAQTRTDAQLNALVGAQTRTEEQLAALRADVDRRFAELVAAQAATEQRVTDLAAAQSRTEQRVAELASAQLRFEKELVELRTHVDQRFAAVEAQIAELVQAQTRTDRRFQAHGDDIGMLKGWVWEAQFRQRAASFLGQLVQRVHVLTPPELEQLVNDAEARGRISESDADEIERTDLICRARDATSGARVFVVVELSARVALRDVEQAARRAEIVARLDGAAIPVVAGQRIDDDARQRAAQLGVRPIVSASERPAV